MAAAKGKAEPAYRDRARKLTAELQNHAAGAYTLWRHFRDVTQVALAVDFHALGVDFDWWKGESDVDHLIAPMVAELDAKHLLVDDQGARIIRVVREGDKRELPPLLVVSSEGSAMYGTTDLATILDRKQEFGPDLVIYCVDQRQADHFEIVFRAAYLAGYAAEGQLEHIGFGTMNGTDGKPFKTREGGVLKLRDLIDLAKDKARDRLHEAGLGAELPAEEFEDIAHKVAIAALKFADLQNFRGTSYVFDLDRFMSFEGKTGPYLLYQAVRVKSLLRKAASEGVEAREITIAEPAERDLALTLDAFDARGERGLRQARAALHRRARLPPGPELFEVLRRLPGADRPRRRHPRLAPGPVGRGAEADGTGAGPAGHRDAGADVAHAPLFAVRASPAATETTPFRPWAAARSITTAA